MWRVSAGILVFCVCVLAPGRVLGQKFQLKKGKILFSVDNASDLLTGEILGTSLDKVLGDSVAESLNKIGLVLGNDKVSFEVGLESEVVGSKKCWYESELRNPVVSGDISTEKKVKFNADKDFMVSARLLLPLDVALTGILHTKVRADTWFKCVHLKDVEFPFRTEVGADVKVQLMVYLNPEVMNVKGRVLLKLDPQIKLMEIVEEFTSSTDIEVEIFEGVRINFVEGIIEDLVDEAIMKRGQRVISQQVDRLELELQEFFDEEIKGRMIDLGNLIDDAEESGVLDELVGAAKLAFSVL